MPMLLEGLTEARRIDDLLDEVADEPQFESPPAVVASNRVPLGGLGIGQVLRNVNWANKARYDWPPRLDAGPAAQPADESQWERFEMPTGAMPLRAFLATVHWSNSGPAPDRPTFAAVGVAAKPIPVATVDSVFSEFAWE